jgi:hypothetical protein
MLNRRTVTIFTGLWAAYALLSPRVGGTRLPSLCSPTAPGWAFLIVFWAA